MKKRKLAASVLATVALSLGMVGGAPAAHAAGCEPGDPNCHPGCELINKTPIVNKHVSCNT